MHQFALLALVDGQQRVDKLAGAAATDFDKYEAAVVEHDEVDLAATAAEVSCNWAQAPVDEKAKRLLFGALP